MPSQEDIENLRTPKFNMWNYTTEELMLLIDFMFHDLGLTSDLGLDPVILRNWLVISKKLIIKILLL